MYHHFTKFSSLVIQLPLKLGDCCCCRAPTNDLQLETMPNYTADLQNELPAETKIQVHPIWQSPSRNLELRNFGFNVEPYR
jgi:hypothetical protein